MPNSNPIRSPANSPAYGNRLLRDSIIRAQITKIKLAAQDAHRFRRKVEQRLARLS